MPTAVWTGLMRRGAALAGAVFLAALLWSTGSFAASPSHHHHTPAAEGAEGREVAVVSVLLPTPAAAPCEHGSGHHGQGRTAPPCCVGFLCAAMPVGIGADVAPAVPPRRAAAVSTPSALLEGQGVSPDLPPPRLG